jgi:hypothetical protein
MAGISDSPEPISVKPSCIFYFLFFCSGVSGDPLFFFVFSSLLRSCLLALLLSLYDAIIFGELWDQKFYTNRPNEAEPSRGERLVLIGAGAVSVILGMIF